jgi:hypothetical protein
MRGRGYGNPERVPETGDLAGLAITTSRVADYGGPRMMPERQFRVQEGDGGIQRSTCAGPDPAEFTLARHPAGSVDDLLTVAPIELA